MIDFSTLRALTIPEGKVKRIDDASSRVLWSAERNVNVTITSKCEGINGDTASITVRVPATITPQFVAVVREEPDCIIELSVGSTIECTVNDTKSSNRCYVSVNGVNVLTEPGTYVYTVTKNVSVHMQDKYATGEYGMITIVEEGS